MFVSSVPPFLPAFFWWTRRGVLNFLTRSLKAPATSNSRPRGLLSTGGGRSTFCVWRPTSFAAPRYSSNSGGNRGLVVATGGFSAGISVLQGNGDGTFGNPIVLVSNLLSIYETSIVVDDFNGDGKLDLALTNSEGPTNAVAILLGNGDGT